MFDSLTEKLGDVFDRLTRRGALSEGDVTAALREVRIALIEADVALPVVKDFVNAVREQAIGEDIIRSVSPGQMVVKIVHDRLVEMLGSNATDISLRSTPPVPILIVGLQGSGKTTTTAKIALRLKNRDKRKVLMVSLDVHRPAAQEQLAILGKQIDVETLPVVAGQKPVAIAERALEAGRLGGYDVVMFDTAGRLHIDEALMLEVAAVRDAIKPHETLLVADALTGQDAVNVAREFNDRVGLTGVVLTRIDGDGRGGAALSIRATTGQPIKLMGVGEKLEALEAFHPDRIAGRILGMGDVVSLVEKAAENVEQADAEKLAKRLEQGNFDMDDLAAQLRQLRKMGGLSGMMGMLPGIGKIKKQMAEANLDDRVIMRQEAIISSMTKIERKNPKLMNGSRRRRIAVGSGTTVQDVNKLLKQHQDMSTMMKQVKKLGQKGFMRHGLAGLMGGGGSPFGR